MGVLVWAAILALGQLEQGDTLMLSILQTSLGNGLLRQIIGAGFSALILWMQRESRSIEIMRGFLSLQAGAGLAMVCPLILSTEMGQIETSLGIGFSFRRGGSKA